MIAYKFLRADGTSVFTGFRWELPNGGPAHWVDARIEPCRSGIHACRVSDLPLWVGRDLWEVELRGEIAEQRSKLVASCGRLLRRIEAWAAVVEPSIREGPALLGFVAARVAEEISGSAAYHRERARQAQWLVERLGLET